MGIFIKRPLCLFCFSFVGASLAACLYNGRYNLYLFFACLAALIICLVLSFIIKKRKYGLYEASIALFMALVAIISSYLFIERVDKKAKELCGEEISAEFVVLEIDYASSYSSLYKGKLVSVNGRDVSVAAELRCEYEGEYVVGDSVFTLASISYIENAEEGEMLTLPSDVILSVVPAVEKEQAIVYPAEGRFDVLCARLREGVRARFMSILDFDAAALSTGLVTGNKSAIDTEVIRDFSRAGLSHVLAVSGLHLAIVVGSAELLMRYLFVRKSVRCVLLSLLSFLLLMLSGFSASACRSVLMLLMTYFVFALSRESDALTSLGVAGFVIILFSPRTVGDIGFWLSFLATLGLVTWLSLMTNFARGFDKKKGRLSRFARTALGKVLAVLATSICATLSISVVSWLVFGEISVIGPVSNIVVTPLCELYLIFSLVVFVFGGIPFLRAPLSVVANIIRRIIVGLASFFSSQSFAVVSLEYEFAGVIIAVFTVLMCLLLILKLRRKQLILAVPATAIAAFLICLAVFNSVYDGTRATYINNGSKDSLVLTRENKAVIFDVSDGTYSPFYTAVSAAETNYATEFSAIVLTHYHVKHISSLDNLFRSQIVRSVYIPEPLDDDELDLANDIARSAQENGVTLVIYGYAEGIYLSDTMSFCVLEPTTRSGSTRKIVNLCIMTQGNIIAYADSSWEFVKNAERTASFVEASDVTILGSHGPARPSDKPPHPSVYVPNRVIASAADENGLVFDFYIAPQ